jgi:hypothetical protein
MLTGDPRRPFEVWRTEVEPTCKDVEFKPTDQSAGFGLLTCQELYARHESPVRPNRCFCLKPTSTKPYVVAHFDDNPYPQCSKMTFKQTKKDVYSEFNNCDDLRDCLKLMVQCKSKKGKLAVEVNADQEGMTAACGKKTETSQCKSRASKVKAHMKELSDLVLKCEKIERTCFNR